MKALVIAALVSFMTAGIAQAEVVKSTKARADVARIVEVTKLVNKPGLQISVVVEDRGGSTDMSPTQNMYLTIYAKGEMFSTDAAFLVDSIFALQSAMRLDGGVYEIKAMAPKGESFGDVTYLIDARKAVEAIKAVQCDDFDCEASSNFRSAIKVIKK